MGLARKQSNNLHLWAEGQNIARAAFHLLRKPFEKAIEDMRNEVIKLQGRAVREPTFNLFTALDALPWAEKFEKPVLEGWIESSRQVLRGSTRAGLADLGIALKSPALVEDELAVNWLQQHGLLRVTAVTETTKRALLDIVQRGIIENKGIPQILADIRATIGLTPKMAEQLQRQAAKARDRGLAGQRLDRFVEGQRKRMISRRAQSIHRTETIAARNQGTLHGWRIALNEGELDPVVEKVWITSGPCPVCAAIAEQGPVPLNRPFFSPMQGQFFTAPPAHINCRCSMGLVDPTLP